MAHTIDEFRQQVKHDIENLTRTAQVQLDSLNRNTSASMARDLSNTMGMAEAMHNALRHYEYLWGRDGEDVEKTRGRILTYTLSFLPSTVGGTPHCSSAQTMGVLHIARTFDGMFPARISEQVEDELLTLMATGKVNGEVW